MKGLPCHIINSLTTPLHRMLHVDARNKRVAARQNAHAVIPVPVKKYASHVARTLRVVHHDTSYSSHASA